MANLAMETLSITELNEVISSAIDQLATRMTDPDQVDFDAVHASFETLAKSSTKIDTINVAYAWIAQCSDAGRLVGSPHTNKYLAKKLGISIREANKRLRAAELLYKKITITPLPDPDSKSEQEPNPEPTPTPEPHPENEPTPEANNEEDAAAKAAAEEAEHQRQEEEAERQRQEAERQRREAEQRRQEQEAERRLREAEENAARAAAARQAAANGVTAEVLDMIESELENLNNHANPGRGVLFARAVREAITRPDHDLRKWLRARIREANKRGDEDVFAAEKKRKLWIKDIEADRGRFFGGYLNPSTAAVLNKAIELAMKTDSATRYEYEPGYVENRTYSQRQLDALFVIANHYIATHSKETQKGVGSIMISVTAEEASTMSASDTFLTNTGDMLTGVDMLRLGLAEYDLGVLHDSYGQVLNLGRTKRTANMWQKMALFAQEGICTCGQCDRAAIWCDVHHIIPWVKDGPSNLRNLTLQCRSHHVDNNDYRTPGINKGHMDTSSTTGRAGYRPDVGQPMEFNNTETYNQCAGAKIRNQHHPNTSGPDGASPAEGTSAPTNPTDRSTSASTSSGAGTASDAAADAADDQAEYKLF